MARRHRARFVALTTLLVDHPDVVDPVKAITNGHVRVDGRIVTNERSRVRANAAISVAEPSSLRGERKLAAALDALDISPHDLLAVDLGAAAGGFTTALLRRGARRVYAIDVGHGQLLGSLRQDDRVVNLERTNLADLTARHVPEPVDIITMDLSYLAVAHAVVQLEGLDISDRGQLLALVKPTFELGRDRLDVDPAVVREAVTRASDAIDNAGWTVLAITVPVASGGRGAVEAFIHARRRITRDRGAVESSTRRP